jgi:HEAT repeat protein
MSLERANGIMKAVKSALAATQLEIDDLRVCANADGTIVMGGLVRSEETKQRATEIAQSAQHVTGIFNNMIVLSAEPNLDELRDQLRSTDRLTFHRAIGTVTAIRKANAATTEPLLPDLYSMYRTSASYACQSWAWAVIRNHGSIAVPFLLQLLDSPNAIDRRNAAELLLGLRHNRSMWGIKGQMLNDRPDTQPEWNSHRGNVIRKLQDALDDPDIDVRAVAAFTLDDINESDTSIVDALIDGLRSTDVMIQNISALHLGRLGAVALAALPALTDLAKSNSGGATARPALAAKNAIKRINGAISS